jgi:tRNA A37 threonylcarbamoyladenosine modification protein TsaB
MPGRLTLAIEISNPSIPQPGVAVGEADAAGVRVLAAEPVRPSTREQDDLVPAIQRLFDSGGLLPRDIGRVAVSVGPGGYTSMRMAVAAGKMIAEVAGAHCVAVPSALVAAFHAREAGARGNIALALAGKSDTAFVTLFPEDARDDAAAGLVMTADQFRSLRVSVLIADAHVPTAFLDSAKSRQIPILAPELSAVACLRASANLPAIDPDALAPIYARQPEAVTLWQARRADK